MDISSWAVATVVIALFFMLVFQRNIRGLIDRTRSVKLPGVHVEGVDSAPQQIAPQHSNVAALATQELGSPMRDQVLEAIEQRARQQISASVPDPKFHLDWALRLFAEASIQRDNEFCYRLIFGSQIQALKSAVHVGGVLKAEKLEQIYEGAAFRYSEAYNEFGFHKWISFFPAQQLGSIENDESLRLNPRAFSFLTFLATSGVSDEKAL